MYKIPSVSAWLAQFPDHERSLAVLTLEHLDFVTTDEVKQDLSGALADAVDASISTKSKILIESVLSKEDVERFLRVSASGQAASALPLKVAGFSSALATHEGIQRKINSLIGPIARSNWPTRSLYGHYHPSEIRDEESGSEKYLDLVVRNEYSRIKAVSASSKLASPIIQGRDNIAALSGSDDSVDIILLTDNIGSGQQIIDFLGSILLSRITGPLRSARITVKVIAWTAAAQGISALQGWAASLPLINKEIAENANGLRSFKLNIDYLRNTKSFFEIEDNNNRLALLNLFAKYGDPQKKKKSGGLGFGHTASRTVLLGSSVQNNIPDFLYIPAKSISYRPLFVSKIIPSDLADHVLDHISRTRKSDSTNLDFLNVLKKHKLVQAASRSSTKGDIEWRILLFAMAGFSKSHALRSMEISYFKFHKALSTLVDLGWLTADFIPTSTGSGVVKRFGSKGTYSDFASAKRFLKRHVDGRDVVYYPRSLRGVR